MTTMRTIIRSAMLATGLALVAAGMTACSDDSTASAPLTSNQITTTSMKSSANAESTATEVSPSESVEALASESPDASRGARDTEVSATTSSASTTTTTTTTAPRSDTVEESVVAPQNVKLTEKQEDYLRALKRQNVTFMGDTDNNVALTMGAYICSEKKKGTDPVTVKAYVTASVGPGTDSVAEASAKADKVIRAAHAEFC